MGLQEECSGSDGEVIQSAVSSLDADWADFVTAAVATWWNVYREFNDFTDVEPWMTVIVDFKRDAGGIAREVLAERRRRDRGAYSTLKKTG